MQKLQIFAVQHNGRLRLGITRNAGFVVDLVTEAKLDRTWIITPPLPSARAYSQLRLWQERLAGKFAFLWCRLLLLSSFTGARTISVYTEKGGLEEVLTAITELVAGRLVTEARLVETLRRRGYWPGDITRALDLGVYRGELIQFPGISHQAWGGYRCIRCNGERIIEQPCTVCSQQDCLICLNCATMGSIRGCDTFVTSSTTSTLPLLGPVSLQFSHRLTPAQQGAAEELLHFWRSGEPRALVWAACGAGKTEVTFPLIRKALTEGAQVLFAIPRQDIVKEIGERLRQAFSGIAVAVHYGGQPWLARGNLVVATTHQVLGFYRRFDLAILDEVDAFPYQGSEMLRFGLRRALASRGRLVEMTATPNNHRDYQRVITIPARYHRHPLPEPRLVTTHPLPDWEGLRAAHLPGFVIELLRAGRGPWLVFAPTIRACELLQAVLCAALSRKVGICHSKSRGRSAQIEHFRTGRLKLLVTTSVLERGVNFPGVQVIVFYADHSLYTVSTLVQIAGRVGRDREHPDGTVLFLGNRISAAMKKALKMIRTLNQEAEAKGLLGDGSG